VLLKPNLGIKVPQFGYFGVHMQNQKLSKQVGMADALFPATRQKVLKLFCLRPDADFALREVIDTVGAGSGAVQREVARLVDCGLVYQDLRGRQKRYRVNRESPIYSELTSLVTKLLGPESQIDAALQPLYPEIDIALLHGSVAKGVDHAGSDVDLLLVSDTLSLEDIFDTLDPAERSLARTINPTVYTRSDFTSRIVKQQSFLTRVLDGPYILLKGNLDEFGISRQSGQD
jgi:predicted nucleotidyltransferase